MCYSIRIIGTARIVQFDGDITHDVLQKHFADMHAIDCSRKENLDILVNFAVNNAMTISFEDLWDVCSGIKELQSFNRYKFVACGAKGIQHAFMLFLQNLNDIPNMQMIIVDSISDAAKELCLPVEDLEKCLKAAS